MYYHLSLPCPRSYKQQITHFSVADNYVINYFEAVASLQKGKWDRRQRSKGMLKYLLCWFFFAQLCHQPQYFPAVTSTHLWHPSQRFHTWRLALAWRLFLGFICEVFISCSHFPDCYQTTAMTRFSDLSFLYKVCHLFTWLCPTWMLWAEILCNKEMIPSGFSVRKRKTIGPKGNRPIKQLKATWLQWKGTPAMNDNQFQAKCCVE